MKKKNGNIWFFLAFTCIVLSLASMFLPIFRYNYEGQEMNFNILDLVTESEDFDYYVINKYTGPVVWDISSNTVCILGLLGILALALAIGGLVTLKTQYPNTLNVILTIIGMIGIMVPSFTAIICVAVYGRYFVGELSLGVAPMISPVACLISIFAVVRRKSKASREWKENNNLFFKGGDL